MPNQKPKHKKAGRPPLPKRNAKAVMLRVRVTSDELKAIEAEAKSCGKTRSEFIRGELFARGER
jgi:hypothetical protein